jgi:predicted RNase H-like nuclease
VSEQSHHDTGRSVGVDWATDGWLAVCLDGDETVTLHDEFRDVWHAYRDADRILVDVPIGLPSSKEPTRQCDSLARDVIGPRRSSVFPPPTRAALGHDDHAAASDANRNAIGKGLSIQAYHIADGIEAVDDLLRSDPQARETIREAHPEVCFRAFAGDPLSHSKTTAVGYAERLTALEDAGVDAAGLVHRLAKNVPETEVGIDDVVDATALAVTARLGPGTLRTLPPERVGDEEDLPMEMVYRARDPL